MTNERRTSTKLEQHFGTISQAVIVGLLVWTGSSMLSVREQVAVMQVEITGLKTTIEQRAVNRYSGTDASRDFGRVYQDISRLEKRIDVLEAKRK